MNNEFKIDSKAVLSNGVEIPRFGLGVFKTREGKEVRDAVSWALEAGYRLIDTAAVYGNEEGVGTAVAESPVPRKDIFITSKVWNSDQGYESTFKAFDVSLKKLKTDYLDLYLIHWPVAGKFVETWKALEKLYRDGRVRAIGVSNFLEHHLEDLLPEADIVPMVNQVEFHPRLQQPSLQGLCRGKQIWMQAWSPLMRGAVLEIPELMELGRKYGKTPVQITLRWMIQKDILTIPKSVTQSRIRDNGQIFDFALSVEEMTLIDSLDRHIRTGADPDNFDF